MRFAPFLHTHVTLSLFHFSPKKKYRIPTSSRITITSPDPSSAISQSLDSSDMIYNESDSVTFIPQQHKRRVMGEIEDVPLSYGDNEGDAVKDEL